jgi:thiol:disulfide interchange protein
LQQQQAALADYRKAAQEHVKNEASAKEQVEIQEQLRLYQKAQVNAQKEIEALTHKDLTKQAQHHKEHKAAQELLHKKQIELRQKGEPK